MKKLTFSFILLLITCSVFASKNSVTIKGNIKNSTEPKVSFAFINDYIPNTPFPPDIELDIINNTFSITKEIDVPTLATFKYEKNTIVLFLEPGDQLSMSFDGADFLKSLKFEGKGAIHNNFVAEYQRQFYPPDFIFRDFIASTSAVDFIAHFNKARKQQMDMIKKDKKISKNFREYMEARSTYAYGSNVLNYVPIYQNANKTREKPELPEDFYKGLDNLDLNKPEFLHLQPYRSFLSVYLYMKFTEITEKEENYNSDNYFLDQYDLINKTLNGKVREVKLAELLMSLCKYGNREQFETKYAIFKNEVSNKEYLRPIEVELTIQAALAPGNKAPDFKLADLDGKMVSLSDFQGKVIYVDFWASWCGPCLQEAPAAVKLKEHYKDNDDVLFLYISIDDDEDAWRKMIEKKELKGVHVLSKGWNSSVPKDYNISGIPRYYIIDRNGNIHNDNAARPSHPDVTKQIDQALNAKHISSN
jgi:thiol-disulfide isomerase/thioredoxin